MVQVWLKACVCLGCKTSIVSILRQTNLPEPRIGASAAASVASGYCMRRMPYGSHERMIWWSKQVHVLNHPFQLQTGGKEVSSNQVHEGEKPGFVSLRKGSAPAADLVLIGLKAGANAVRTRKSRLGRGPAGGLPLVAHEVLGAVVLGALTSLLGRCSDREEVQHGDLHGRWECRSRPFRSPTSGGCRGHRQQW